jgi:type IV secretion system protein VirD4
MSILRTVRREYGVNLRLLYQSLGQERWRFSQAGERTWFDSAFPKCFASIQELDTAEMRSQACGGSPRFAILARRAPGLRRAGNTIRVHATSRAAVSRLPGGSSRTEENIQRLQDEQIVLVCNTAPLQCGRTFYLRQADMLERDLLCKVQPLTFRTSR